jgi:nitrile hydratase accessory protein
LNPPEAPTPQSSFEEPWQAQAFALTLELHQRGAFSWSEWAATLAGAIAAEPDAPYYESWLAALESLARAKNLTDGAELSQRKHAWEAAYLTTPHGKPGELAGR